MKLNMSIDYDVEETSPEVKTALEEIIGEEARAFVEAIRRRLAAEGVTDINLNLADSPTK
jgi:hypothetical protein